MSLFQDSTLAPEQHGQDDGTQRVSATFDEFIPPGLLPPAFHFQPVNTKPTMVIPTPRTTETTIDTQDVKAAVMATTPDTAAPRRRLRKSPPLTPPMTDEGQTSQDSEEVRFVNPLDYEPIHVIDHYAPNDPPPTQDADPWAIADPYEFVPPQLRPPHAAPIPANHPGEWSELPPLPQTEPMSPKSQKMSWNKRFVQKAASPFSSPGFLPDTLEKETEKAANIVRMFCSKGIYADVAPAGKKKKRSVATIPPKIMARARGLAIFTTLRASISISSSAGSGIVISRLPSGRWSAPSAIRVNSFGGGIVAGIDIYDCVCVINTNEALAAFMSNRVSMGSDLAVSAGPWGVGRNVQVGTALRDSDEKRRPSLDAPDSPYDMPLNRSFSRTTSMDKDRQDLSENHYKPVFSYVKSRGLYAGLGFDGTFVLERKDANRDFYGQQVSVAELLHGHMAAPENCEAVKKLYAALKDAEGGILTAPSEEDFEPIPYQEPSYEESEAYQDEISREIDREVDPDNRQMTLLEALRMDYSPPGSDARPITPTRTKQVSWETPPNPEETTPRQYRKQPPTPEHQDDTHSRRISWQGIRGHHQKGDDNEPPSWEREVTRRASTQGWPLARAAAAPRLPPIDTHQTQYYQHAQWRAPIDEQTELMMEPVSPVSSVSTLEDGKAPSVVSRLSDEWVRPSPPTSQGYFTGHTGTWYTAQKIHGMR